MNRNADWQMMCNNTVRLRAKPEGSAPSKSMVFQPWTAKIQKKLPRREEETREGIKEGSPRRLAEDGRPMKLPSSIPLWKFRINPGYSTVVNVYPKLQMKSGIAGNADSQEP
ncbi:hypothetical protein BT69DRAFT_1293192 [Atractiella rhizophila]|nr:hypothetical protein BT69DRAFT_1293192 [Atractiella rhizophila]